MIAIWVADVVLNAVLVHDPIKIIWPFEYFGYVRPGPPLPRCRKLVGRHRIHRLLARPVTALTDIQG